MKDQVKTREALFDYTEQHRPVNVASVPQRSPFRYPGGKTWLIPHVRRWLRAVAPVKYFYEPFLGGGSVSLTVAFEDLAQQVIMVEKDEEVAAVWKVLLSGENEKLAQMVESFRMCYTNLEILLSSVPETTLDLAFITLVRNRTYHGGILAPGSGKMKHGENGKGLASRWYPQTLAKRIRAIADVQSKVYFIEGNGFDVIKADRAVHDAAFFIDPPYTVAGKRAGSRLYKHFNVDHELLFKLCSEVLGSLLMTYDNCEDVAGLAERHGLDYVPVPMKNTHNATMTELLIGKELRWVND
jgi:DNA adenine methylase